MTRSRRMLANAVRLKSTDWQRVRAVAALKGVAPATALRELVLASLSAADENRQGPFVEIEESLLSVRALLNVLGPVVVGMPHLLAYWATREAQDITPDDLVAEFAANAEELWKDSVAKRGASATPSEST